MKRTAIKRHTPMPRPRRWGIKPGKPKRLSRVGADPAYLAFVRTLECCAKGWGRCEGVIEANHARKGVGMGRKAPDRETFPLCHKHHAEWHDANGTFKGWLREQRRTFERFCIWDIALLATPDNRAHAYALEALGLGRWADGAWIPGPTAGGVA